MKAFAAIGAITALTLTGHCLAGESQPEPALSIHIGTFENSGWGQIAYTGDLGQHISVTTAAQNQTMFPTVIAVDISSILSDAGYNAFTEITVNDTGENQYSANSPGADIDWFELQGLGNSLDVLLSYDGPVELHEQEDSDTLKTRVNELDALSGQTHQNSLRHVSLGDGGELVAQILGWPSGGGGNGDGGGDGDGDPDGPIIPQLRTATDTGITLMLSESGMGESFDVYVTATNVPSPAAAVLLGLAGAVCRRRRRND